MHVHVRQMSWVFCVTAASSEADNVRHCSLHSDLTEEGKRENDNKSYADTLRSGVYISGYNL